ncbi:MAG TPA: DNA-binding domain-containing protein, partial [Ramlibacter sp.]
MKSFARALLDAQLPCPGGLRAWNGSDPARRFAVHRNSVVASLADALADTFPVVQALVGEAFFRAMAVSFVRARPPSS